MIAEGAFDFHRPPLKFGVYLMKLIQSMLKGRNHIFPHHFMARWPPKCGELADIPSSGGNCLPSQLRMLFYVAYYCELMSLREFSTHHRYVLRTTRFWIRTFIYHRFFVIFHEFFESSSSTVSSSFLENGFFSVKYFVVIKFLQTKMISSAKRATDQRQQQKPFPCFFRATTATTENSNHFSHAHLRRLLATFLVWPYQETSSDFSFFLRLKKQFGVRQIIKSRTMANRFWLWIKIKLGC